jgi:FkbM family methyltransferase
MGFISYAQNNEDAMLNRIFGRQQVGFYVDVGASHPVEGSVTKLFYDRGWSGINVEPSSIFDKLAAERPRDVNLRMAVLDWQGVVPFRENTTDLGMSHVVDDGDFGCTVPCDTLPAIIAKHAVGRPIDFIKIDVEGVESAIVRSTDWRRVRPRVLVIEATKPWSSVLVNEAWEPDLLAAGYARAYFDGVNCFYVPEEEWPTLEYHFRSPINVLDGVVPHAHAAAMTELAAARKSLASAKSELADNQGEFARLQAELDHAQNAFSAALREQRSATDRLNTLLQELSSKEGPRALRSVLPVARLIRCVHRGFSSQASVIQPAPVARPNLAEPAICHDASLASRASIGRRVFRRLYHFALRPLVRPLAWRAKRFLSADILAALAEIRQELAASRYGLEPGCPNTEASRLVRALEDALVTILVQTRDQPLNRPVATTDQTAAARPNGQAAPQRDWQNEECTDVQTTRSC